jgi:hypothetical protein
MELQEFQDASIGTRTGKWITDNSGIRAHEHEQAYEVQLVKRRQYWKWITGNSGVHEPVYAAQISRQPQGIKRSEEGRRESNTEVLAVLKEARKEDGKATLKYSR